jgi:hypothetical protein
MKIDLQPIADDCDHSGLFPSPGGGKARVAGGFFFVAYGHKEKGSVARRFDGGRWEVSPRLPVNPPYIDVDSRGFVHLAGLHQERRDEVWHFRSAEPFRTDKWDEGAAIHPKNYSSMAIDPRDDSLYYFGAGVHAGGLGFRRRAADGAWSKPTLLVQGQVIYPGVAIRDGVIHLMFCGWDPPAAIYENVFYIRSGDGGATWTRGDGQVIKTPHVYHPAEPESVAALGRVSRTLTEGHAEPDAGVQQLFVDGRGRPHVLYSCVPMAYFPQVRRQPRCRTIHARLDSGGWRHSLFSDDPDLDVGAARVVQGAGNRLHCVCGVRSKGRRSFDLAYCRSGDSGDTWSALEAVTDDADARGGSYTNLHWAPHPFRGDLCFVCNRSGGGPVFMGRLRAEEGG